jgi:molecular chaperone DnaK (HSP70)
MSLDLQSIQVVVGIDFGTSRSGYAYAFKDDQKVVGRTDWPGQPMPYIKTLTQILYSPDQTPEAWGYEAKLKLAQLRKSKKANAYAFLQNFKMQLREAKTRTADGPILKAGNGQNFVVLDVIADYLRFMYGFAREELDNVTSGILKDEEILWCLTIPAIWTDADKQLMRRAAQKAGLISESQADAGRLLLVLEPEAAAIACQEKDKSQLKPGNRYMVVDCGGGTVDITAHEVVGGGGGLKEIAEGTGGCFGSMYVDQAFLKYLNEKLSSEVMVRFHDNEPIDYLEMLADWERAKCNYCPNTSDDIIYFPLRPKLYKILANNYEDILEKLAKDQEDEDDSIHLSSQRMQAIFDPVLEGLMQKVEEQFQRLGSEGCDLIFLVGGFSTSPLLRQRFQERFGDRVKKIIMPSYPGHTIVEGAVLFGLNPSIIRARRSRLSYGCCTNMPFDDARDPKDKRFYSDDHSAFYCRERFSPFVIAGDSVGQDEIVTHTFYPMKREQTVLSLIFYATKKKIARYVDESAVEKLGELEISMPDTTEGLSRLVEVTMYFGKTEIKVQAKDKSSGTTKSTTLRFSTTYSSELIGE